MEKQFSQKSLSDSFKPLPFYIDGKRFESTEQFKSGSQLKELAGIPLTTEIYLEKEEGYEAELISNEKVVDLARKEKEQFFVKKKLNFTINGVPFISYKQYVLGSELKKIGNIPNSDDLFLKIAHPFEDELISDEEEVNLARPGKEHFISKQHSIVLVVNARPKPWVKRTISFEELVILAFGAYDPNPNKIYTVTYSGGLPPKPEGSMIKGQTIQVKNKMNFDVSATDKS
ncbi:MAG: multiubiquitin domain-containing protein [Sphingobacteriia bacterium]